MSTRLKAVLSTVLHHASRVDPQNQEEYPAALASLHKAGNWAISTLTSPDLPLAEQQAIANFTASTALDPISVINSIISTAKSQPRALMVDAPGVNEYMASLHTLSRGVVDRLADSETTNQRDGNAAALEALDLYTYEHHTDVMLAAASSVYAHRSNSEHTLTGKPSDDNQDSATTLSEARVTHLCTNNVHQQPFSQGRVLRHPIADCTAQAEVIRVDTLLEHYNTLIGAIERARVSITTQHSTRKICEVQAAVSMNILSSVRDAITSTVISELAFTAGRALSHSSSFMAASLATQLEVCDADQEGAPIHEHGHVVTLGDLLRTVCQTEIPSNVLTRLQLRSARGLRLLRVGSKGVPTEQDAELAAAGNVIRTISHIIGSDTDDLMTALPTLYHYYADAFKQLPGIVGKEGDEGLGHIMQSMLMGESDIYGGGVKASVQYGDRRSVGTGLDSSTGESPKQDEPQKDEPQKAEPSPAPTGRKLH